jgi:ATP-binding cassette, subfamily C, bacterial
MMIGDILNSVKIFCLFAKRYPLRTVVVICFLITAGVAEGFSISLIIPLIQQVLDPTSELTGRIGHWTQSLFNSIGCQPTLTFMLALMLVGILLKNALVWTAMNQVGFTIARVAKDLRMDLIKAILHSNWSYFVKQRTGHFSNALTLEAQKASSSYLNAAAILSNLVQVSVYFTLSIMLSWKVALSGAAAGVFFILMIKPMVDKSKKASKKQVYHLKNVSSRLIDTLQGLKSLKVMRREKSLFRYLETNVEELNLAQRDQIRAHTTTTSVQEPVLAVYLSIGLYVAVNALSIPVVELFFHIFVFVRIFGQTHQLVLAYQRLVIAEQSFISIRSLLYDIQNAKESSNTLKTATPLSSAIRLENVDFSYGDQKVLQDVSIDIPAHSWTSLVGPSGAGKTTISDLVAGLYVPHSGSIIIDGVPLTEIQIHSWRKNIGYVPQDVLLLHDTIKENIILGEDDLGCDEVQEALRMAGAQGFVNQLPDGVNTVVGERGARLSGGQKQRISLARALVRKPDLLILDEASASLDPETEARICETLLRLKQKTTILSVSHQPAFANAADHVYRIEAGRAFQER